MMSIDGDQPEADFYYLCVELLDKWSAPLSPCVVVLWWLVVVAELCELSPSSWEQDVLWTVLLISIKLSTFSKIVCVVLLLLLRQILLAVGRAAATTASLDRAQLYSTIFLLRCVHLLNYGIMWFIKAIANTGSASVGLICVVLSSGPTITLQCYCSVRIFFPCYFLFTTDEEFLKKWIKQLCFGFQVMIKWFFYILLPWRITSRSCSDGLHINCNKAWFCVHLPFPP